MIYGHASYRSYLKNVLSERIARNPAYSLRALARQLGIAPSTLSEVLKGKINLSLQKAHEVAHKLQLGEEETEYFATLVEAESAKTAEVREALLGRLKAANPVDQGRALDEESFRVIAEWYHVPILLMANIPSLSRLDARRISERLGITPIEVEVARDRLVRLGMLEKLEDGRYQRPHGRQVARSETPSGALRLYHRQMLERAIGALEGSDPGEKIVGSETFTFDPDQLPEARRLTDAYFGRMVRLAGKSKNPRAVFHLAVQFFDLTRGSRKPSSVGGNRP